MPGKARKHDPLVDIFEGSSKEFYIENYKGFNIDGTADFVPNSNRFLEPSYSFDGYVSRAPSWQPFMRVLVRMHCNMVPRKFVVQRYVTSEVSEHRIVRTEPNETVVAAERTSMFTTPLWKSEWQADNIEDLFQAFMDSLLVYVEENGLAISFIEGASKEDEQPAVMHALRSAKGTASGK